MIRHPLQHPHPFGLSLGRGERNNEEAWSRTPVRRFRKTGVTFQMGRTSKLHKVLSEACNRHHASDRNASRQRLPITFNIFKLRAVKPNRLNVRSGRISQ